MINEWYDCKMKPSGNFRKLLQEHLNIANLRRTLTDEENKCLAKLEGIAEQLRRGKKRTKSSAANLAK